MFGYSIVQLYFLTNCIYTIVIFFLFHGSMVERIYKNHHMMTKHRMTDDEIKMTMNIFYISSAFFGSIKLLKDTLNLIFDHKSCLWLHWFYRRKKK
jgi:hypothetical protein